MGNGMTSKLNRSIAILDVGHGNSTVVIEDDGVLVVDAGPKNALLEFLHEQDVTHVDVLLISHADQDHLGALAQLIASREFTVGRIALNSDADQGSDTWNDVLHELTQAAWRKELRFNVALVPEDGPVFDRGSVRAEVLGPSQYLAGKGPGGTDRVGRRITTNSISAVIGLSVEGTRMVLLPGDIDEIGVDDLLSYNKTVNTSILVFPHHGGKPGTANIAGYVGKLCDAVDPQVVIFSTGRGLYGTPNREVVAAIRERLPTARIMCTQLSEHCSDVLPDAVQDHLNDVFCGGREHRQCCAGTILIDLDETGALLPSTEGHREFIDNSVKQPLCCS
jgi:beta-lactamase superfamily II metal-dependent hydrolase